MTASIMMVGPRHIHLRLESARRRMSAADRGPCLRPSRLRILPCRESSSTNRTSCPEPRTCCAAPMSLMWSHYARNREKEPRIVELAIGACVVLCCIRRAPLQRRPSTSTRTRPLILNWLPFSRLRNSGFRPAR